MLLRSVVGVIRDKHVFICWRVILPSWTDCSYKERSAATPLSKIWNTEGNIYRPPNKFREGNVLTGVCLFTGSVGISGPMSFPRSGMSGVGMSGVRMSRGGYVQVDGYVHRWVCLWEGLSRGWVCPEALVCLGGGYVQGVGTPDMGPQGCPPTPGHTPSPRVPTPLRRYGIQQDTVGKWAARILRECCLVITGYEGGFTGPMRSLDTLNFIHNEQNIKWGNRICPPIAKKHLYHNW